MYTQMSMHNIGMSEEENSDSDQHQYPVHHLHASRCRPNMAPRPVFALHSKLSITVFLCILSFSSLIQVCSHFVCFTLSLFHHVTPLRNVILVSKCLVAINVSYKNADFKLLLKGGGCSVDEIISYKISDLRQLIALETSGSC